MTQQELASLLGNLRQIDDPGKTSAFWNNLIRSSEETGIKLETNGFAVRRGHRGVRLYQPCGFISIEIFDEATSWPKTIAQVHQPAAWELLSATLAKLRAEEVADDPTDQPAVTPYE